MDILAQGTSTVCVAVQIDEVVSKTSVKFVMIQNFINIGVARFRQKHNEVPFTDILRVA